ncbi:DUF3108 domain-containing protein [Shimia haliotis]|uniref:DUF3108 domain-containing protein n=1 Tax=Shimia haliotis TaxID=1280847 RepID=A0A1I4CT72_9RHOB|nr:DUF3108 domain-containing protein [Shimia haliotis]SFK84488.1 Protein of unknown function [Shimia haliotis]
MRQLARNIALGVWLAAPAPLLADQAQLWSVHAFGLKVGELKIRSTSTPATYNGNGTFKTTGLAGVLRRIRFTIAAHGTPRGADLLPMAYDGFIDTGRRVSETKLRFQGGLPIKIAGDQDPETPISNAAKRGALDPMSMMLLTVRDQSDATLCTINETQFDGTRLVRINLRTRNDAGDHVECSGTYDRIGGYSADELAELKTSPLSITYHRQDGLWQAQEIRLTSRHGKAKLLRQE